MSTNIQIYNLFPRYYNNFKEWEQQLTYIKKLGFNTVYINPFHYVGFSGSLYAVKDYYDINPAFVDIRDNTEPLDQLKRFLNEAHKQNLKVIMDFVANHSSKDSLLTTQHPTWYLYDKNNQLQSPGAWENGVWVSWGDLAQFDHFNSLDKNGLWGFFSDLALYYTDLGFDGFRADAAYQIPSEFWTKIITATKKVHPNTIFIAENLGAQQEQSLELTKSGFDYLCSSAKWWDFTEPWFIEQHNLLSPHTKSISFPENHDTTRIAANCELTQECITQLITFTGLISSSWMIVTGTEHGWKNKPNVVSTNVTDQEPTTHDFESLISKINTLRTMYPILENEGFLEIKQHNHMDDVLILEKRFIKNTDFLTFMINKSKSEAVYYQEINGKEIFSNITKPNKYKDGSVTLAVAEIRVFVTQET